MDWMNLGDRAAREGGQPRSGSEAFSAQNASDSPSPTGRGAGGMSADIWGQDIALDASGQARVAANGELVLTDGVETGVQDVRIRLSTYLGTLFYDKTFGCLLPDWFYEESTESSRAALCAELVMRTEEDPRVTPGSVSASILKWDDRQVMVRVEWRFIGEDSPLNLVLQADKSTRELVVRDASPRSDTLVDIF